MTPSSPENPQKLFTVREVADSLRLSRAAVYRLTSGGSRLSADRAARFVSHGRLRLPIGSGVTETACKTVFTQRFKSSGMKWNLEGGAVVLALRVAILSQTWARVRTAMFRSYQSVPASTPA